MMSGWKKISVQKHQQVEALDKRKDLDAIDKTLLSVCAVFDMDPDELDKKGAKVAIRLAEKMTSIFTAPLQPQVRNRIGRYILTYDIDKMNFGQYVELQFFLQDEIKYAHYVLASISHLPFLPNNSKHHKKKSEFFLKCPIEIAIGCVNEVKRKMRDFNAQFPSLFGLSEEPVGASSFFKKFNDRYGWEYSARSVATDKGINLDQAFKLPVREALHSLSFLKAKGRYEAEMFRESQKNTYGR